jgi:hypothetical protein
MRAIIFVICINEIGVNSRVGTVHVVAQLQLRHDPVYGLITRILCQIKVLKKSASIQPHSCNYAL